MLTGRSWTFNLDKHNESKEENMTDHIKDLIPDGAEIVELDPDEIVAIKDTHDRTDYGDIDALAESIQKEGRFNPSWSQGKVNGAVDTITLLLQGDADGKPVRNLESK